jgi:hypothetical protein
VITCSAGRQFSSPDAEAAALIYNYQAVYTEADTPGFEQVRTVSLFHCCHVYYLGANTCRRISLTSERI